METWVRKTPLEKEIATHSSIHAWKIPWTTEPGGYGPWGRKDSDMTDFTSLQTGTRDKGKNGGEEWLCQLALQLLPGLDRKSDRESQAFTESLSCALHAFQHHREKIKRNVSGSRKLCEQAVWVRLVALLSTGKI